MATSPDYTQNVWTARNFVFPRSDAPATDSGAGAALKIGFGLLLLDTFVTVSRSLEIAAFDFGVSLPLVPTAIHALAFGFAFLAGGARRLATTRTGILLILFTGWMIACTPFSSWRTGSAQTALYYWIPSLMGFLASGLLSSVRQCRKIGSVIAISGLSIAVVSFWVGTYKEQRFSFNSGTLGNANELAMLLLLAAPFFLIPLFDPATKGAIKFLASVSGLLVLAVNFRTGSRAGLVALFAILLALFLAQSLIGKLKLVATAVGLAALLVAFIPSYSLYRYTTIFSEPDSIQDIRSDETYGSTEMRKELLRESMMVTLQNPVFGVGPGVYASAMAKEAERRGKFAHWAVSHNTYTQVSSEMGIPGLIFYLAATMYAYLDLFWVRKHSRHDPSANALALGLLLSLFGLNVNFFFDSNAYLAWLPILLGLSAALRINLQRDLNQRASVATPAAATPRAAAPQMAPSLGMRAIPDSAAPAMLAPVSQPTSTPAPTYRFLGRPPRIRR
jgi:O-antigen ligase